MNASAPLCIRCGYDLTALESPRCPECGWMIDWALARADAEGQLPGTPAHRAKAWRRIPAALATAFLMLFRPIRFARVLRHDEPLLPALGIAILAYLPMVIRGLIDGDGLSSQLEGHAVYLSGLVACVVANIVAFVLLCGGTPRRSAWRQRLRTSLLLLLYSTCFVAGWGLFGPPLITAWNNADFYWPLNSSSFAPEGFLAGARWEVVGRSICFYWWFLILLLFAVVRARSRWIAAVFLITIPLAAMVATKAATLVFDCFD